MGGVHLDTDGSHDSAEELIEKIEGRNFLGIDLDFKIQGLNSIYYELYSIGQNLAESPDTEKFIERIDKLEKWEI
jgi:hypothetical protein